ncbi:MAG: hypothetical protein D6772_10980 [Bacteroidetes bacterium]|nr:MAG: hypothetical protein D6772_10980 [Bacteroidota bacterium]
MLLLSVGLMLSFALNAQHQLGLRTDTYAGISGAFLNPAASARTPWAWDIQLGGASQFFHNNYAYLENTSNRDLLRLLRAEDEPTFYFRGDISSDFKPVANSLVYDFRTADRYDAQSHTSLMGPGFSVQLTPYTRVGLFSAWHTMDSISNVDENLGYYRWNSIPSQTPFRLSEAQVAGAAWGEVGLNLSQGFPLSAGTMWLGVSLRRLWGQRAAYLRSEANFSLEKLPDYEGLAGLDFDLEGGFTNNLTDENIAFDEPSGRGWGLDLGWWYQIEANEDYQQWEFGVALLDLGGIRFAVAQTHRFTSNELTEVLEADYNAFSVEAGITPIAEQFSEDVFGAADASRTGDSFRMRLATSLSGQVRYNFNPYFGLEAAVISGLGTAGAGLQRATTLAITPRIDQHWWSVALPVSWYAGETVRLGLSARLGPLVVGTDDLGSYLRTSQWDGTDAYFAVKWFPLGLGKRGGSSKRRRPHRSRGGKPVECYKF